LGVAIGSDVQAWDAGLDSIAGLTTTSAQMLYTTASDTYAVTALTAFARTLIDDPDEATARATLGAVGGRSNLNNVNRLTVVASAGEITESTWSIAAGTMTAPSAATITATTSLGLSAPFVGIAGATKKSTEAFGVAGGACVSGTLGVGIYDVSLALSVKASTATPYIAQLSNFDYVVGATGSSLLTYSSIGSTPTATGQTGYALQVNKNGGTYM